MHIVSLQAENVKRLQAVEIHPDGSLVIIGGDNAQGKTSVLDSIEMALGGGSKIPSKPIREGADKARIVADLEDIVVTRTFTRGGSYLDITNKDGSKPKSPQALLDSLVGRLSFDPLGFTRLAKEQQTATLKELVGLDFSDLDALAQQAYDERRDINRDTKALKARYDALPFHKDAPKVEIDIGLLTGQIQAATKRNAAIRALHVEAERTDQEYVRALEDVTAAHEALRRAEARAAERLAEHEAAVKLYEGSAMQDTSKLEAELSGAEASNQRVRQNRERAEVGKQYRALQDRADALTAQIDKAAEERTARLAAAKWPIDGLTVDENGVAYNEIPFDQCSGAEQLQVSVAMGIALNPKLKVLLIRDGSLLDKNSLKALAAQAEAAQAQVWLERVGDKDKCAVIIEDGQVREAE